jgi:methyl-accepting chemotaxis protein
MKNSSLASNINLLIIAPFIPVFGIFGYLFSTQKLDTPLIIMGLISVILLVISYLKTRRFINIINKIKKVTQSAFQGNLEKRIIGIGKEDSIGEIAWYINEMLDQLETVFREINTILKNMSRGKYLRRAFPEGLHGNYAKILDDANENLNITKETMTNLNQLMEALAQGNFDQQINIHVEGELKFTVDQATHSMKVLKEKATLANQIAQGNLSAQVTLASENDQLGNAMQKMVTALKEKTQLTHQIAQGNLDSNIVLTSDKDELGQALQIMINALNAKVTLAEAIAQGDLSNPVILASDQDTLGKALQDMVKTLNTKAQLAQRIAQGDLTQPVTLASDKDELGKSLQQMVEALTNKISLTESIAQGDLSNPVILASNEDTLGKALQNMVKSLQIKVQLTQHIAQGDLSHSVSLASDKDELGQALKIMLNALNNKVKLAESIALGDLSKQVALASENDTLGNALQTMIDALKTKVNLAQIIAQGDLSHEVKLASNNDELGLALQEMIYSLNEKVNIAEQIAAGDLTSQVMLSSDTDSMGIALEMILKDMNKVLGDVKIASDDVTESSNQLSMASNSLAQGSTEQAAAITEISASMDSVKIQSEQNTQNTAIVNNLVSTTRTSSTNGDQQMQKMAEAMQAIDDSSRDISKIIQTINEITFQTNLLALNASVEAAHAGKFGKGFAVVANEVRSLANKSSTAAKETTEIIGKSMKNIRNGSIIVEQTSRELNRISNSVMKLTDLTAEIEISSQEQGKAIHQISQGLTQMETVTQQNSSNATQTSSQSDSLTNLARELNTQINKFQLKSPTQALEFTP